MKTPAKSTRSTSSSSSSSARIAAAKKASQRPHNKRRYTRFKPDLGAYAQIDTKCTFVAGPGGRMKPSSFAPEITGLVIEESHGGCSVVVASSAGFDVGSEMAIKIGTLAPLQGKIVWIKQLDMDVSRLGIHYLE